MKREAANNRNHRQLVEVTSDDLARRLVMGPILPIRVRSLGPWISLSVCFACGASDEATRLQPLRPEDAQEVTPAPIYALFREGETQTSS